MSELISFVQTPNELFDILLQGFEKISSTNIQDFGCVETSMRAPTYKMMNDPAIRYIPIVSACASRLTVDIAAKSAKPANMRHTQSDTSRKIIVG